MSGVNEKLCPASCTPHTITTCRSDLQGVLPAVAPQGDGRGGEGTAQPAPLPAGQPPPGQAALASAAGRDERRSGAGGQAERDARWVGRTKQMRKLPGQLVLCAGPPLMCGAIFQWEACSPSPSRPFSPSPSLPPSPSPAPPPCALSVIRCRQPAKEPRPSEPHPKALHEPQGLPPEGKPPRGP